NDWDDGAAFHSSPGANGARGDVRIAMRSLDGSSNVLAFNNFPADGDMTLDADDIGFFSAAFNNNIGLRDVVMHAHAHGIGLLHVGPTPSTPGGSGGGTKLMEPFIFTGFDGPQHDDIRAAHTLYGDKYEPNDSIAQATNLASIGPLNFGVPLIVG